MSSDNKNGSYAPISKMEPMEIEGDDTKTKDDDKQEKLHSVPFLGMDLQTYSKTTQFCVLSFGIFFFYLLYGIAMEQIFRYPGKL